MVTSERLTPPQRRLILSEFEEQSALGVLAGAYQEFYHDGKVISTYQRLLDAVTSADALGRLGVFIRAQAESVTSADGWAAGPHEFFARIKQASHLFQGLTDATYSRSEGWEFIQFGKFIERADKATRILDVKYHILLPNASDVGGAIDTAQWQAVLRSASALEAYRRAHVSAILPWKAAEFLIFSDSFPRSLHYCAVQVEEFLRRILGETGARPKSDAARAARRLLADLQSLSIADVIDQGLHEFLQEIQTTLDTIGEEVVQTTMFYPAEAIAEEQQQQQQ
jgi:uncharacterized alpha-E superfamily protein